MRRRFTSSTDKKRSRYPNYGIGSYPGANRFGKWICAGYLRGA
jgi:hypothetical protein